MDFQRDLNEFTDRLGRYVGWTPSIKHTADTLLRAGRSYATIQERWCCEEMSDETTARLEKRETSLESKIAGLAQDVPDHDSGAWRVRFDGDPRGYVVRLVSPDGTEIGVA